MMVHDSCNWWVFVAWLKFRFSPHHLSYITVAISFGPSKREESLKAIVMAALGLLALVSVLQAGKEKTPWWWVGRKKQTKKTSCKQMSSDQLTLVNCCIEGIILPSYMGIITNHDIRIPIKQPVFHGITSQGFGSRCSDNLLKFLPLVDAKGGKRKAAQKGTNCTIQILPVFKIQSFL